MRGGGETFLRRVVAVGGHKNPQSLTTIGCAARVESHDEKRVFRFDEGRNNVDTNPYKNVNNNNNNTNNNNE